MAILHDFLCPECEYIEERLIERGETLEMKCPNCEAEMHKVYLKSPAFRMGGEGSDRQIASMQKSFRERFKKKEADDIRHKHGKDFDDSLAHGEVRRIKNGNKEKDI